MNSKQLEDFSVSAVKDAINQTDLLRPYINDNDKEPSWDGNIYIYNDKECKKNSLKGRIPVQVKGHEEDDHTKSEISYSMEISDLNNYLNDGGVILFVVYVGNRGITKKIYYCELTPIKLRIMLSEAKGQKTKNVRLKTFPTDIVSKTSIFFNCFDNCQKQSSFTNAELYSIDELKEKGCFEGITIPITTVGNEDPKSVLVNSEIYVYAKIKGSSIPQPLELLPTKMRTEETINSDISINDVQYYSSIRVIRTSNKTSFIIGNSFSIVFETDKPCSVKYKNSKKLRILIKDLEFILAVLENNYFMVNGQKMSFEGTTVDFSNFDIETQKQHLKSAKEFAQVLDALGYSNDVDMSLFTDEDFKKIDVLIHGLLYNKSIRFENEITNPAHQYIIGSMHFALTFTKDVEKENSYYISDFFDSDIPVIIDMGDEKRIPATQYMILTKKDFLELDNIKFEKFLPAFQLLDCCEEVISRANWFLLDLISAYDECEKDVILSAAFDFSKWLCETPDNMLPREVKVLNKLQVLKRMRGLNSEENAILYGIVENPKCDEAIKTGAYLLLDQQEMAQIHFDKIDLEIRKDFVKYPIYRFWNKSIDK